MGEPDSKYWTWIEGGRGESGEVMVLSVYHVRL
jgi:hypothetical protein